MHRLVAACLVSIALGAGGCAEEEPEPAPAPPQGRLVVQKSLADGPMFIEGSVTYLRIVAEDGAVTVDGLRPVERLDEPLLDRSLPAGLYHLAAVERPCAGNCGLLDPPAQDTRCTVAVTIAANETTRVEIVLGVEAAAVDAECSVSLGGRS